MKKVFVVLLLVLSGLIIGLETNAWGFYGHKQINKLAVFTLPPEMIGFYKRNIEYITKHAVDADKRRYKNPHEAPRHFIDADKYGPHPFDSIPQDWNRAAEKYTEDTLNTYGIVPWYIHSMYYRLVNAFKKEDEKEILYLSANIGHYIADAHVPLHTTMNYNGQLTNQVGIHGLWESRIPELSADHYNFFTGRAFYIKKPLTAAWEYVRQSHLALDSVLNFEKQLSAKFPIDKKYMVETKGRKNKQIYTNEYALTYEQMLHGMVERRMRASIIAVGSFWYTAWVDAGQPDLSKFYSAQTDTSATIKSLEDSLLKKVQKVNWEHE